MKKRNYKNIVLCLIGIIIAIILFFVWFFYFKIDISIKDKNITINLFDEYIDSGYNANICFFNNCKDFTNKLDVVSNINTNKSGEYEIVYSLKYFLKKKTAIKRIKVINDEVIKDKIEDIENYIESNNYKVSVGYYSFSKDYTYTYNEDEIYFGASLIKTLDALYIYEQTELNDTTRNLVKYAISISDNESHYKLLDIIGYNTLKEYGINLGALNTLKGDKVNGYTTVEDQFIYLKKLYDFINNNELGDELKEYFINDYGLRLNFDDSLMIMHKFGHYDNVYHDVGIVLTDEPYIIVVLTKESKNDYSTIIRTISNKVYELNNMVTN